jgi:hypothetical protein
MTSILSIAGIGVFGEAVECRGTTILAVAVVPSVMAILRSPTHE